MANSSKRLIPLVVEVLRKKHYSDATIASYTRWIKRLIRFHEYRHPLELNHSDIEEFLSELASVRRVSASTQNQAINAISFLYKHVLHVSLKEFGNFTRAKRSKTLPEVFTPQEIADIFSQMSGTYWLMANLIYGAGLRISECLQLRIKDVDFENSRLIIRQSKGRVDRFTPLPAVAREPLVLHLEKIRGLHNSDIERGFGRAPLPYALVRKYPKLDHSWSWQFVFPSNRISTNRTTQLPCRHHCSGDSIQRSFRLAIKNSSVQKTASIHNLRHSFATHMLLYGTDIRTIQKILGHKNIKTTSIYLRIADNMRDTVCPTELLPAPSSEKVDPQIGQESPMIQENKRRSILHLVRPLRSYFRKIVEGQRPEK